MSTKSVAEKLLLKGGRTVLLVNPPPQYEDILGSVPEGVIFLSKAEPPVDVIQLFVRDRQALESELPRCKQALHPKGILWVTYYKGTSAQKTDIHRDSIAAYAASLGLAAVAIISVDQDWSALRLKLISET